MSDAQKEKLQKLILEGELQPATTFLEEVIQIDPDIVNTGLNMNGMDHFDESYCLSKSIFDIYLEWMNEWMDVYKMETHTITRVYNHKNM